MRYQSIIASVYRQRCIMTGNDHRYQRNRGATMHSNRPNSGFGFVHATTRNHIGDAVAVLSRSRRLALGSSWCRFLAAKNFLKTDTPLSMRALTSIIPGAQRRSISVRPDRSVDRLAAQIPGGRRCQ
jgi:hypothetical protein